MGGVCNNCIGCKHQHLDVSKQRHKQVPVNYCNLRNNNGRMAFLLALPKVSQAKIRLAKSLR